MQVTDNTNVFVKFLPSTVDDTILREWFEPFGTIRSAKVMIDFENGNSLGYGFVRFYQPSDALQAITHMSGKRIQNKTLLCKLAYCSELPEPSTNLYIKPLPISATENTLRDLFSSFGKIVTMRIMRDEDESAEDATGIGFVRFEDQLAATTAMEKVNGYRISKDFPPITIKYADCNKNQRSKPGPISPAHTTENSAKNLQHHTQFTTTTTSTMTTTSYAPLLAKSSSSLPHNNNHSNSYNYNYSTIDLPHVSLPAAQLADDMIRGNSVGYTANQQNLYSYGPYYYCVYYVQAPAAIGNLLSNN